MAIRKTKQTEPKTSTGSKRSTSVIKPNYQTPPDIRTKYDQMRAENTQKALQNSKKNSSPGPKNQGLKK